MHRGCCVLPFALAGLFLLLDGNHALSLKNRCHQCRITLAVVAITISEWAEQSKVLNIQLLFHFLVKSKLQIHH